ncbi:hypothetical protein DL769_002389 [Monosporascus sp. CRB-8-3]|nr:hypothetical protein DL769_002389 [Monosporascus sp. CRB-8-3]
MLGSLARIGPNELVTDDPGILKRMAARSAYTRSMLDPVRDNIFSMRDENVYTKLSGKMATGVSPDSNLQSHLVELIENKYTSTGQQYRPMDWARQAQYFTLDFITDRSFGRAFGYLEKDDDAFDYIRITEASLPLITTLTNVPSLGLLTNPGAYSKLQKEIDNGIAAGKISSPIKDVKIREMPYLQAVINEWLQSLPPAAGLILRPSLQEAM